MFCFYSLLLELYYTSNLYNGKNKSVCKEMNMRCDASIMIRRAFKWCNFCCLLYVVPLLYACCVLRPTVILSSRLTTTQHTVINQPLRDQPIAIVMNVIHMLMRITGH